MPLPYSPPPTGMPQEVIDFRTRTFMPKQDVDDLWQSDPGYLEAALAGALANITARLRKRYRTPFDPAGVVGTNPKPEIVVMWQSRLVTPQAYLARGYNPSDPGIQAAREDRDAAVAEIKEAADAVDGLYDIPLLDTVDDTRVSKGGPTAYAEPSPYDWLDVQRAALNSR
jgi:hypothetical protein